MQTRTFSNLRNIILLLIKAWKVGCLSIGDMNEIIYFMEHIIKSAIRARRNIFLYETFFKLLSMLIFNSSFKLS